MKPKSPLSSPEAMFEHADFLRQLARALLRDEHRAEDVLQETWIVALDKPPTQPGGARAYLASVVRNLASNVNRSEGRRGQRERIAARPEAVTSDPTSQLEVQRKVFDAVLALDEPLKGVVYLRYFEGLMPKEIAQRESLPVKTVKSRLHRALGQLRETLDRRSGGERALWASALLPMAHAREIAAASGGVPVAIGGILLMKKLMIAAVVLVLLVGAWTVFRGGGDLKPNPSIRNLGGIVGPFAVEAEPTVPETTKPAESAIRESVWTADEVGADVTTGTLALTFRWESDESPAQNIGVDARVKNDPAPREEFVRGRTNADGFVSFEGLEAGPVDIFTDRGNRFELEVRAGQRGESILLLPPGEDLVGVVRGSGGEPLADAELWVECTSRRWPNARLLATTHGDGSFRMRGLSARGSIGARAAGYLPSLLFEVGGLPVGAEDARRIEFVLERGGGRVSGVVLDPEGEPVRGALVLIGLRGGYIVDLPDGRRAEKEKPVAVLSNDEGRFEFAGHLPVGQLPTCAIASGFPVWEGQVNVERDRSAQVTIQLQRPATIVGRVLTSAGEPHAGAQVLAAVETGGGWFHHMFPPSRTTSAEDGTYELRWVAPGQREVNASNWQAARQGRAKASVLCKEGQVSELDLRLDPGATIRGRVVNEKGEPLVGWAVYANPVYPGSIYPRSDRTDEDGGFVLGNLGDSDFRIDFCAPGDSPYPPRAQLDAVTPGTNDLEVIIDGATGEVPTAHVLGQVLTAFGSVPQDIELLIHNLAGNNAFYIDFNSATGEFRHGPLRIGKYKIQATRGNRTLAETEVFEIDGGEDLEIGKIRLAELGSLALEIAGLAEEEVAALRPKLDREGHGTQDFEWVDGAWVSHEVLPGPWILRLGESRQFLPDAVVTLAGGEQVTHRVEVGGEITEVGVSCTVSDPDANWSRIELIVRDSSGDVVRIPRPIRKQFLPASAELRFYEVLLPTGTFELEARTDTGHIGTYRLRIEESLQRLPNCEIVLR